MASNGGIFGNTSNQNLLGDLDPDEMENIFEEQEALDDGEKENDIVNENHMHDADGAKNNDSDNINMNKDGQPEKGE